MTYLCDGCQFNHIYEWIDHVYEDLVPLPCGDGDGNLDDSAFTDAEPSELVFVEDIVYHAIVVASWAETQQAGYEGISMNSTMSIIRHSLRNLGECLWFARKFL